MELFTEKLEVDHLDLIMNNALALALNSKSSECVQVVLDAPAASKVGQGQHTVRKRTLLWACVICRGRMMGVTILVATVRRMCTVGLIACEVHSWPYPRILHELRIVRRLERSLHACRLFITAAGVSGLVPRNH